MVTQLLRYSMQIQFCTTRNRYTRCILNTLTFLEASMCVKDSMTNASVQHALQSVSKINEYALEIPIVAIPKKDGGVRICVDTRSANDAIQWIREPIPTVEDVSFLLNGAQYFSKLDLSPARACGRE